MFSPPTITFTRRILVERDAPLSSSPIRGVEGGVVCLSRGQKIEMLCVRARCDYVLACLLALLQLLFV